MLRYSKVAKLRIHKVMKCEEPQRTSDPGSRGTASRSTTVYDLFAPTITLTCTEPHESLLVGLHPSRSRARQLRDAEVALSKHVVYTSSGLTQIKPVATLLSTRGRQRMFEHIYIVSKAHNVKGPGQVR